MKGEGLQLPLGAVELITDAAQAKDIVEESLHEEAEAAGAHGRGAPGEGANGRCGLCGQVVYKGPRVGFEGYLEAGSGCCTA